ncbi:MAG: group III truncated hemoglobin [Calditrichaeota bacterium]|nr:group III truncated hemoglobin [Calditrichota bacterium]
MKDIENRFDIEKLIRHFYDRILADDLIGFIFTDIAKIDLEEHLPILFDFWEMTLFNQPVYKRNPMRVHIELHRKQQLKSEFFDRWLSLFNQSVDDLFKGQVANLAKTRALSIAFVMQNKLAGLGSRPLI